MKKRAGFTIIEVVLVLALAGLIFAAMAIAIPNLIRSQRDSERRADFAELIEHISQYQANNRKALPEINAGTNADGTIISKLYFFWDQSLNRYHNNLGTTTGWDSFLIDNNIEKTKKYLPEPFQDPLGDHYNISITTCNTSIGTNNSCNSTEYIHDQSTTKTINDFYQATFPNNYLVLLVINAKCESSESLIAVPGKRNIAVLYKYENGGTYCGNN